MNNQNVINEIRSKIDIVDFIGEYVPLIQKGKNFFGVCPFHNDTNPSMSVSRDKQIYKCFSCGASGNVFTFLMDYEHIDFKEALKILADRTNISIGNVHIDKKTNKYDKYYDVYDLANKFYQNNINSSFGSKAKEYLKSRGIDDKIIKEFGIGLSLEDSDSLTKLLKNKNYNLVELENIGLISNGHDAYINRIMFPLHDINGRTVGFSGRIYDNSNLNKYLNTKETVIFKKGECLYNYHIAKDYARRAKFVIVMEGFMDVIRASTIDYKNVVALMGTALTKEQISLIKKLSQNVILCLDGDNPGQKAMLNVGNELEKNGLKVKVIVLNDDDDPDTFILKNGKEAFDNLVENAINYSDYRINNLKKGVNFNSDLELSNYINNVLQETSKINDEIRREIILKKLAIEVNISYNTLEKRLNEYLEMESQKEEQKEEKQQVKTKLSLYDKACYAFIYCMLNSSKVINYYNRNNVSMVEKAYRHLASEIYYYYTKYGEVTIADFYTYLTDKAELLELYNKIISYESSYDTSDKAIEDYVKVINKYNERQEIKRLNALVKKEIDPIEKAKIAEQIRLLRIGE